MKFLKLTIYSLISIGLLAGGFYIFKKITQSPVSSQKLAKEFNQSPEIKKDYTLDKAAIKIEPKDQNSVGVVLGDVNAKYPVTLDPAIKISILNLHSHPQQGENWTVEFKTQGAADLKIIPNDQTTIDDDEFVSLKCNGEVRTPQILAGDIIFYPDWSCDQTAMVVHYTKKAGKHTLRFEFGDQVAFAYNNPDSSGPNSPGTMATDSGSGGTQDWAYLDSAKVEDGTFATALIGAAGRCLAPDTLISTKEGEKAIKDLKEGDLVYTYNFASGKIELKEASNIVNRSISFYGNKYYHIYFESGDIRTTYNHFFYVDEKLVMAKDLKTGDELLDINARKQSITEIVIEENYDDYVYDLSVNDNQNFFANGILVHNVGVYDHRVRIIKGGAIGSTDRASGTAWPSSLAYTTYGSSSDLWGGEPWTADDINASDFGVAISAYGSGYSSNYTTYYLKATNFGFSIPTGSTINGITVEIKKGYATPPGQILAGIDHIRITVDYTPPPTEFVSVVDPGNNNGTGVGVDYTSLSAWNTGVATDLTAATTQVFAGTRDNAPSDNAPVYLCTSGNSYRGESATVVHATATQILVESIASAVTEASTDYWYSTNTCSGGTKYFTISDGGNSAIAVATCRTTNGAADTAAVTISGWTTSATNYIKIWADPTEGYRHSGKWDDGKYRLDITGGAIDSYANYIRIDGLQIKSTGSSGNLKAFLSRSLTGSIYISNNIIVGNPSGTAWPIGIDTSYGGTNMIWNNIVYGWIGGRGIDASGSTGYVYNNTFYGNGTGIYDYGTDVVKNNLSYNNTTDYSSAFKAGSTNNLSKDATSPNSGGTDCGGHSCRSQTVNFVNANAKDFHLAQDDTSAKNSGADLATDANLPVTTDIDGSTRPTGANVVDIGADEASTQIYYSVGQNTSNHCGPAGDGNSCGNVSITSGVATFTAAQAGTNLGVGDALVAGGNTYYLSSKSDTSHWGVITATGATPSNLGSTAVTSISHAFASLSLAEAGSTGASYLNTTNLVTGNYVLNIPCYNDAGAADTTAVTVDGWTTGSQNYIKIYTPNNTTTEVNQTQRHSGKWDDGKYQIDVMGTAITSDEGYIRIDGLQIRSTTGTNQGIRLSFTNFSSIVYISNSIIKDATDMGIYFQDNGGTNAIAYVWNNIIYDCLVAVWHRPAYLTAYYYNNTFANMNASYGIIYDAPANKAKLVNNLVYNSATVFGSITAMSGSGFNATDHDNLHYTVTGGSTGDRVSQTFSFLDETNKDFHLAFPDTGAKGYGVNLMNDTYLAFQNDIDGQERTGNWSIGADEPREAEIQSNTQKVESITNGLVGYWSFDGMDSNIPPPVTHTYSANATWSKPANLDYIVVESYGAGGAGGAGAAAAGGGGGGSSAFGTLVVATGGGGGGSWAGVYGSNGGQVTAGGAGDAGDGPGSPGSGGGGGAYATKQISAASLGSSYAITVGIGGNAGGYGIGGGGLYSGGTVTGYGGGGGGGSTGNGGNSSGDSGGAAGTGACVGDSSSAGDNGVQAGAGGTAAGPSGGGGGSFGNPGGAGTAPGGGGGGGSYPGYGGAGATGEVIVTEYYTSTTNDLSGNNNTGTVIGATPAIGKKGQGLSFNGTSDYVDAGNTSSLSLSSAGTVSVWFKMSSLSQRWNTLVSKENLSSDRNGYVFIVHGGDFGNQLAFELADASSAQYAVSGNSNEISTGQWYHAVLKWDSSNVDMYLNGVNNYHHAQTVVPVSNVYNFLIGQNQSWSSFFPGLIDEVRVYNRALSVDEVGDLYTLGQEKINMSLTNKNTSGLVGMWSFDGADINGTTAYDRSGSIPANDGTISGATPAIGKHGQALSFNGTTAVVQLPNNSTYDFNYTNNFTVSSWIKINDNSVSQPIFNTMDGAGNGGYTFSTYYNGGLYLIIRNAVGASTAISNGSIISNGIWYMATAVFTGPTSVVFYLNGVNQGEGTFNKNLASVSSYRYIGFAPNVNVYYNGSLDEVRVYNRALSADEVGDLYHLGSVKITN